MSVALLLEQWKPCVYLNRSLTAGIFLYQTLLKVTYSGKPLKPIFSPMLVLLLGKKICPLHLKDAWEKRVAPSRVLALF